MNAIFFLHRCNIQILGALIGSATSHYDYDYVIDVLDYTMNENIKPNEIIYKMLSKFKNDRYYSLQKVDSDEEQIKFNRFYTKYKQWKTQMELNGLSSDEAFKLLRVHPWRQLKETEGDGIEIVKNKKTRRMWKRQHSIFKLTSSRLERIDNNHQSHTNKTDQTDTIENKIDENEKNSPEK